PGTGTWLEPPLRPARTAPMRRTGSIRAASRSLARARLRDMAARGEERTFARRTPAGLRRGTLLRVSLIQLNGIVKSYGGRRTLDGLDFDVVEGARIGVIGPNGGG